jgi:hypothetical protein
MGDSRIDSVEDRPCSFPAVNQLQPYPVFAFSDPVFLWNRPVRSRMPGGVGGVTGAILSPPSDSPLVVGWCIVIVSSSVREHRQQSKVLVAE